MNRVMACVIGYGDVGRILAECLRARGVAVIARFPNPKNR
jgi:phosphoglycerate dehydrogenase-like enzyme